MILEQAFYALPEVLHGSGYQQQDYEAGLVNAFSHATLQVLNGRNAQNPIGCIQNERLFRTGGIYQGLAEPRYLRADLFINTSRLFVANRRLAQYGWRHNNWLEAKFLRGQTNLGTQHSGNKTAHVAGYLADLVRMGTLVGEVAGQPTSNARYFLHVYDSEPKWYLTFRNRQWCRLLCEAGEQEFTLDDLDQEPATVRKLLGDLPNLSLKCNVTNFLARPLDTEHHPIYWCYLTRINAVTVTLGEASFEVRKNRTVVSSNNNAIEVIARFVAEHLHIEPDSTEAVPPPEPDPVPDPQPALQVGNPGGQ